MWIVYALLSALFAAITSILAKIGIANVNSNLATAIRTIVVLVMAWGIVFFNGTYDKDTVGVFKPENDTDKLKIEMKMTNKNNPNANFWGYLVVKKIKKISVSPILLILVSAVLGIIFYGLL